MPPSGAGRDPGRPARSLLRLVRGASLGLGLGLVLAVPLTLLALEPYTSQRDIVWLPLAARSVNRALLCGGAAAAWVLGVFGWGRSWIRDPRRRALAATFLPWLAVSLVAGRELNRRLLPGFFEPASWVGNAVAAVALLLLWIAAARGLLRWQRAAEAWRPVRGWALLGALALVPIALDLATRWGEDVERPDTIVLLVDVLRADHLGAYGYERATTPNLDRFAADAVLFENAIAQSTFTKTSVASLFTGLYPHEHGVYLGMHRDADDRVVGDVLAEELTTVAEALAREDVLPVAWVRNKHLRARMGFGQGFALYDDGVGTIDDILGRFRGFRGVVGRRVTFFAYLHFLDLHAPYAPPPPWDTLFGRFSDRLDAWTPDDWSDYQQAVRRGEIRPRPEDVEQMRSLYDGQLAFVDARLGALFERLEEEGLYERSLIVLLGDHGEGFMEHGFLAHSNTPYEELIRVPLLVKLPGSAHGGRRVASPVALVDVAATLLDVYGAERPEPFDGRSLAPLWRGDARAAAEATRPILSELRDRMSVRTARWKYLEDPRDGARLYDLERDPGETRNVLARNAETARELAAVAERARASRRARARRELSEETVEQLRALGYVVR